MAHKLAREEMASSSSATAKTASQIDETHAVQLACHFADLYKSRRFTDLKVGPSPFERVEDTAGLSDVLCPTGC